ncbi:MAG: hypothetical protein QW304_02095 [Thermoproteota archaeon]
MRKNKEHDYSSLDTETLAELLILIKNELQLVDKTSSKRRILEWYYGAVKSLLEDGVRTRLLKSLLASVKTLEKMANQDPNNLSKFSSAIPELDLRLLVSQPLKEARNRKTLAIIVRDIDRFIGEDGKEYGPYPAGCLVNIPYSVAKILEDNKAAEEIFIT